VKVTAFNSVGSGPSSSVGGDAVSAVVPNPPINLARNQLLTTVSQVSLTWADPVFDGGSSIIDYQVSYDQGTGVFLIIGTGLTSKAFTTTSSQIITPGKYYAFKVAARNAIGYSTTSTELSILAATVPP
jgi:hypothetical protein